MQGKGYSERLVARQGLIWEAGAKARVNLRGCGKARVNLGGWWQGKGYSERLCQGKG